MPSETHPLSWLRSSACRNGSCVEVAAMPGGMIALRDSKRPELGHHVFDAAEWRDFLVGAKENEFDHLLG